MHIPKGKFIIIGAGLGLASGAFAQSSLVAESIVGITDPGTYIYSNSFDYQTGGATATAQADLFFTGLDGNNNLQTMEFNGTTISSESYTKYHVYTTGTVTNSYYNASNAPYWDGSNVNPAGSPTSLTSLGFAISWDTLTFGGALQPGYVARYIFHVEGTNYGYGSAADLAFNIGTQSEGFFAFDPGYHNEIWATQGYAVDTPQSLNIQFSDQFVLNTFDVPDGSNVWGTSDFGSTLIFDGIVMEDAAGNIVDPSTWTVTSDSGTAYTRLSSIPAATPEPSTFLAVGGAALLALRRRNVRR
jgi:hypothetical protein